MAAGTATIKVGVELAVTPQTAAALQAIGWTPPAEQGTEQADAEITDLKDKIRHQAKTIHKNDAELAHALAEAGITLASDEGITTAACTVIRELHRRASNANAEIHHRIAVLSGTGEPPWNGTSTPDEEARPWLPGDIVQDANRDLYWRTWDNAGWVFLMRSPGGWDNQPDLGPIQAPLTLLLRLNPGAGWTHTGEAAR